jgi:hypothetical protein
MTSFELFNNLSAPFPIEFIEWRIGSTTGDKSKGMALCYVDARAVMERLDSACNPGGWQCNYSQGVGGSIICNIGLRMQEGDWVWKADGAGATDVEGEKGALSDAFKRAAVRWGVGRYLYDLKAPWVEIQPRGKSYFIPDHEVNKLNSIHENFVKKGREPVKAVQTLPNVDAKELYKSLQATLRSKKTEGDLKDWINQSAVKGQIAQLPPNWQDTLRTDYQESLAIAREPV